MKISEPWCKFQLRLSAANVLRTAHLAGHLLPLVLSGWRRSKYRDYFAAYLKTTGAQGTPGHLLRDYCRNLPLQSSAPFIVTKGSDDVFRKLVRVAGFEHVRHALVSGRGAITVSTHFGRGSLVPAYLSRMGVKVCTIRRRELSKYEGTDRGDLMFFGTQALYVDKDDTPAALLKRALGALQQNAVICILADGIYGSRTTPVTLFGQKVLIRTGLLEVARLAGAPAIPAFGVVRHDGISIRYYPPVSIRTSADIDEFARNFAGIYEQVISEDPSRIAWNPFHISLFTGKQNPLYSVPGDVENSQSDPL